MLYSSCKTSILVVLLTGTATAQPLASVPPSFQVPVQSPVTSQGTTRFSWGSLPLPQGEPLWSSLEMLRSPFGSSSQPLSPAGTSPSFKSPVRSAVEKPAPPVIPPSTPQVIRTTKRVFAVPFQVSPTSPADIPREVELLFSTNRGFSWQSYARQSPDNSYFVFQTDNDGEYWFRIRIIGQDGTATTLTPQQPPTIVRVESESVPSSASQPTISSSPSSAIASVSISDQPPVVSQSLLPPMRSTFRDADPQNVNFDDMFPVAMESPPIAMVMVHLNKPDISDIRLSTEAAIRLLDTDPLPFVDTISLDVLQNDTMYTDVATVPTDLCGKITLVSLEVNVPRPYIVLEWDTGGIMWNQAKVTVFRGETASGPWTTIAGPLDNTGKHSWYLQQEDSVPFHLCIELHTSDGNMVGDITIRPIHIP